MPHLEQPKPQRQQQQQQHQQNKVSLHKHNTQLEQNTTRKLRHAISNYLFVCSFVLSFHFIMSNDSIFLVYQKCMNEMTKMNENFH